MAWQKGQSGNPGGRPRKTKEQIEFEQRAQRYMAEYGFKDIEAMAKSEDKRDKKWALEVLLDRGFGKPQEVHDVTNRAESDLSFEEVAGELAELAEGQAGEGARVDPAAQGTA